MSEKRTMGNLSGRLHALKSTDSSATATNTSTEQPSTTSAPVTRPTSTPASPPLPPRHTTSQTNTTPLSGPLRSPPGSRPTGPRRPPRRFARPSNTPPTPPTQHPSNYPPEVVLTPAMLQEREQLAHALQLRYHCSAACATSTVNSFYPDEDKCRATVQGKMTAAFVLAVGMVPKQREYVDSLCSDLAAAFQHFPLLNGSAAPTTEEDRKEEEEPIDWALVRTRLLSPDKAPLWHMHTEVVVPGDGRDVRVYENAYKSLITKEGFTHVVGGYGSGDGVLPALDYVNARLCGESVQSLARRIGAGEEVVEALDGVEAEVPTPMYTRVNAFGNDPATSCSARQDKGMAQQLLKEAGLAYIRCHVTTSAEEAIAKIADGVLLLPVVVKPNSGAGSEFVTLCYTADDVRVAFSMVEGVRTSQGTDAAVLVVEEYIEGPEYVVNTVSYHGVHIVTDVWESWKYPESVVTTGLSRGAEDAMRAAGVQREKQRKTSILYDKQTLITNLADLPVSHAARRVTEYTLKCLDALGLENGCGHSELRLDTRKAARERRQQQRRQHQQQQSLHESMNNGAPRNGAAAAAAADSEDDDGEPILIELNSRMQGDTPRSTETIGYDQYSVLLYIAEAVNVFGGATAASTALPFRGGASSPWRPPRRGEIPWPPVPRLYRALPSVAPSMATTVLFLATKEECILNGVALRAVTQLRTFHRFTRTLFKPNQPGFVTPLRHTVDLFSSPTSCVLHGAAAEVEADCATIRAMESAELGSAAKAALHKLASSSHDVARLRENARVLDNRLHILTEASVDVAAHVTRSADAANPVCGEGDSAAAARNDTGNEERSPHCELDLETLQRSMSSLQSELEWVRSNIAAYDRRASHLRSVFAECLKAQQPSPLYINYQDFTMMKAAGVGNALAVE